VDLLERARSPKGVGEMQSDVVFEFEGVVA